MKKFNMKKIVLAMLLSSGAVFAICCNSSRVFATPKKAEFKKIKPKTSGFMVCREPDTYIVYLDDVHQQQNSSQDQQNSSQDQQNSLQDQQNSSQDQQNSSQDQQNSSQDQQNSSQDQQDSSQDQQEMTLSQTISKSQAQKCVERIESIINKAEELINKKNEDEELIDKKTDSPQSQSYIHSLQIIVDEIEQFLEQDIAIIEVPPYRGFAINNFVTQKQELKEQIKKPPKNSEEEEDYKSYLKFFVVNGYKNFLNFVKLFLS